MGPKTGMAQIPVARLPFGKSDRRARPAQLAQHDRLGRRSTPLRRARDHAADPGAVPFWLGLLIIVALPGGARRSSATRRSTPFEKYAAIVLGDPVRDPDDRDPRPRPTPRGPTGSAAPTRSARSSLYVAIVGQLRPRLGAVRVGLLALPARRHAAAEGLLATRSSGMSLASVWLEILGLLVAGPGDRRRVERHRSTTLLGGGNIIARARDGRDRLRHGRRQRDERLHGLAVAPGGRHHGSGGSTRPRSSPSSASSFTLYLEHPDDFAGELRELPARSSATGSRRRRRRPGRLVARGDRQADADPVVGLRGAAERHRSRSSRWSSASSSSIPFRTRRSATLGGPFNYVTANYLHGADIAYYVGRASSSPARVYWVLEPARGPPSASRADASARGSDSRPPRPSAGAASMLPGSVGAATGATMDDRLEVRASRRGAAISSQVAIHSPSIARARSMSALEGHGARRRGPRRTGGSSA